MDKNLEASIRITIIYAAFAAAWILFSDKLVEGLGVSARDMSLLQTLKGWLFVAVTALILFVLVFRSHQRIQQVFQLDALTGLSNHYMFKIQLGRKLNECPSGQFVLLCYLDVDDFKALNQREGYEKADHFLVGVAEALVEASPPGTLVGRFPPDQFGIAVPLAAREDTEASVAAILRVYRDVAGKNDVVNDCSMGVAIYPDDGRQAKLCMDAANEAHRRAKLEGSTIVYHDKHMSEMSAKRQELLRDLATALEKKELTLVYQPKIDLTSFEVTGVEVLVRWYHSFHGLISPATFIPIAEEHGLINKLTAFVISRSAQELGGLSQLGNEIAHVSVNVSASEFNRPEWMESMLDLIRSHPTFAHCLRIEITETATLTNIMRSAELIARFRDAGIGISIDDFGTGYTSLAMLKDLTVDELKIDKSFVADLAEQGRSSTIVKAILAMAETFGIDIVAEGVETEDQLAMLRSMNCQQAQGYLLGAPMKLETLKDWLAERVEA